ncbi:MAG: integrase domain-containing protein [Gammaproteobacteria bacterium]|nr:integrase domain-containing protein [Gammaproteobacteria bacterium]MDE0040027.1 integrase domain-containing protein [Gammaproteobacteria bacterium]
MRQLNHDLKLLQDDARDGAYGTRSGRSFNLALMANTLHELGYRRLRATGLRGKHVEALVREWQHAGLSIGTMKNRMSHLRWWAKRIGKPNVVRADNASYGIGDRKRATNEDRSRDLPDDRLALVKDEHVRMALRLQEQFGLRREEAIKFSSSYADRGSKIVLKASWTKGGRAREIQVLHEPQRGVLDEARALMWRC